MNEEWNRIYINNRRLDDLFISKYISDKNLFKKNCIELLVELGEFINETKIFKYWSIKKSDKDKIIDEYADVIIMILYFYYQLNIDSINVNIIKFDLDVLELINSLYFDMSSIMNNLNRELLDKIFNKFLYLGSLLSISEVEILKAIKNKQKIIEERLNSDY